MLVIGFCMPKKVFNYFPLCVLTVESTGAFPILEASQVILEQPLSVLEYTATLELVSSEQN